MSVSFRGAIDGRECQLSIETPRNPDDVEAFRRRMHGAPAHLQVLARRSRRLSRLELRVDASADPGVLSPSLACLSSFLRSLGLPEEPSDDDENEATAAAAADSPRPLELALLFRGDDRPESQPTVADAMLEICRAFMGNDSLADLPKRVVVETAGTAPPSGVAELFVRRRLPAPRPPTQTLLVRFRGEQFDDGILVVTGGSGHLVGAPSLEIQSTIPGGLGQVFGVPSFQIQSTIGPAGSTVTRLLDALTACGRSENLAFFFEGSPALPRAVAAALRSRFAHPVTMLRFFAKGGVTGGLDGSELLAAAAGGRHVEGVSLAGFSLFGGTGTAAILSRFDAGWSAPLALINLLRCALGPGALPALSRRPVSQLLLSGCTLAAAPAPILRVVTDLVRPLCQSNPLKSLSLENTPMEITEMVLLCDMLSGPESKVEYLRLGGQSTDCVEHFLRRLPSMVTVRHLTVTLKHVSPASLSNDALDGIRNNYSLRRLDWHGAEGEESDRLVREAEAHVESNSRGRGRVSEAVANRRPDLALDEIHRLAASSGGDGSDPAADFTALFLCLKLLLPSL